MAYDRADWHSGEDFPKDLPPENGGTHIGMFIAWAIRQFGVPILCLLAAFGCATDKNRSPIARYDAELHEAVKKSWHDSLRSVDQTRLQKGTVVVRFLLRSNGQIADVMILKNSSGVAEGLIVARAVMNHANYKPWPEGMAQMVGENFRLITFQFNYK